MDFSIRQISFEQILPIWKNELWPDRVSPIESCSSMVYLDNSYTDNFSLPAWFLGCFVDSTIVGVNSGHMCVDGSARSRGLWVNSAYRNNSIGKTLLVETTKIAVIHGATSIWSFPRKSSFSTYAKAEFTQTSQWQESETSEANAYCVLSLA